MFLYIFFFAYANPASILALNKPFGSYLSVNFFQSCGRLVRKYVIIFREFLFCTSLHFEQSVCMASGNNPVRQRKTKSNLV